MDTENNKSIEEINVELEKSNKYLVSKISLYENGDAKLYYAIQRKMSEMAMSFNNIKLNEVDMQAKSDATFDRLFKLLEKCETIAKSASALGELAGITGDEKKDIAKIKKPYSPESVADEIGELAGRKS